MKIGLISFAHMHAASYAENLLRLPGVSLGGIFDQDRTRGEAMASRFQSRFFADCDRLLATDIEAVVVCSENALHKEFTLRAAKAGKHVLCEKPIATTIEDADSMIEACAAHGVKLETAFPCRYLPAVARGKAVVESGDLGRVLAIKGTNHGAMPGGWFTDKRLAGGGAVMDHTVHVADLMRWYLQSEVVEVYAEISNRMYGREFDDCGMLSLQFDNGVFATIDPSWSRTKSFPTWGDVTLRVTGTEGVLDIDAFNQHVMLYNDDRLKAQQVFWGDDMDYSLVKDFVEAVRDKRPVSITGEDGREALRVALAAYESGRTHKPVPLKR